MQNRVLGLLLLKSSSDRKCEHQILAFGKLQQSLVLGTISVYGEVVFKLALNLCIQSLILQWMCPIQITF